jgi:hypothetical protein
MSKSHFDIMMQLINSMPEEAVSRLLASEQAAKDQKEGKNMPQNQSMQKPQVQNQMMQNPNPQMNQPNNRMVAPRKIPQGR